MARVYPLAGTASSFVLEGRMGALLGDNVLYADAGELAFKPRDQWHTFWNAGDEPCRILEIISPAGFEHFFREWDAGTKDGTLNPGDLSVRYGIEFDMESVPRLCAEHGLVHPLRIIGPNKRPPCRSAAPGPKASVPRAHDSCLGRRGEA
jgi:hypothetical protein